jgi:hypothetical protein
MALKDWLLSLRNKAAGLVAYGGTISRTTETDEYPIAIANELMGGAHSYDTLGSLAELHPENMVKGMICVVNQHNNPGGTLVNRTAYILEVVPTTKISEEVGYDELTSNFINNYWKVFTDIADYEGSLETEYAPNVNSFRPIFDIGSPWYNLGYKEGRRFEPTAVDFANDSITISNHGFVNSGIIQFDSFGTLPDPLVASTNYYAKKLTDNTLEVYLESGLLTLVDLTDAGLDTHFIFQPTDIWLAEYDGSGTNTFNGQPTVWMRQRVGTNSNWGMPVKMFGSGYQEGDYVDTRFQWTLDTDPVPAVPAQSINGRPNNEPVGWFDIPDVPAGTTYDDYLNGTGGQVAHYLYKTTATKDVYGNLKTPWTDPYKISTDPDLVQYGDNPGTNPDTIPDAGWEPFYNPNVHTHMASRATDQLPWIITRITNEEGQYTEYVFKEFLKSYVVTINDAPAEDEPAGNNGWFDAPFALTNGDYVLYVSIATKFNDGSLKSEWSVPQRFDGLNTIQTVIKTDDGTVFKWEDVAGTPTATPALITLEAITYNGGQPIDTGTGLTYLWYKGDVDPPNHISVASTLEVNPGDVDGQQVYTVLVTHEGLVYEDKITILDVTDSVGYNVSIVSLTGFTWKGAEQKTFSAQFYNQGVPDNTGVTWQWTLENYAVPDPGVADTNVDYILDETHIEDYAELTITATLGTRVISWTERLTDVVDGEALDVQYHRLDDSDLGTAGKQPPAWDDSGPNGWDSVAIGAFWMRTKKESEAWDASSEAIRIRGEEGVPAGGFVMFAFVNTALAFPAGSTNSAPTGLSTALLPTANPAGWTDAPINPVPLSGTFTTVFATDIFTSALHGLNTADIITVESTGTVPDPLVPNNHYYVQKIDDNTFYLRDFGDTQTNIVLTDDGTGTHTWTGIANESTWQTRITLKIKEDAASYEFHSDNWTPVDSWSIPIKVNGKDGAAIGVAGSPGQPGTAGWAPQLQAYHYGEKRLLKLIGWIGGTGSPPVPSYVDYYMKNTSPGWTNVLSLASDFRGEAGQDGSTTGGVEEQYLIVSPYSGAPPAFGQIWLNIKPDVFISSLSGKKVLLEFTWSHNSFYQTRLQASSLATSDNITTNWHGNSSLSGQMEANASYYYDSFNIATTFYMVGAPQDSIRANTFKCKVTVFSSIN